MLCQQTVLLSHVLAEGKVLNRQEAACLLSCCHSNPTSKPCPFTDRRLIPNCAVTATASQGCVLMHRVSQCGKEYHFDTADRHTV